MFTCHVPLLTPIESMDSTTCCDDVNGRIQHFRIHYELLWSHYVGNESGQVLHS